MLQAEGRDRDGLLAPSSKGGAAGGLHAPLGGAPPSPFDIGCLPLSCSGDPGVKGDLYKGANRKRLVARLYCSVLTAAYVGVGR